jgi:hypothetical protein
VNLPAAFKSLSFLTGFVRRFGALGPVGGLIAPTLGALADLVADGVRLIFNALGVTFKNPIVFSLIFMAMAYGYYNGHAGNASALKSANERIAYLSKIKRCAAPATNTSPPSMWDSIFK